MSDVVSGDEDSDVEIVDDIDEITSANVVAARSIDGDAQLAASIANDEASAALAKQLHENDASEFRAKRMQEDDASAALANQLQMEEDEATANQLQAEEDAATAEHLMFAELEALSPLASLARKRLPTPHAVELDPKEYSVPVNERHYHKLLVIVRCPWLCESASPPGHVTTMYLSD
jgi:hypothetical protein